MQYRVIHYLPNPGIVAQNPIDRPDQFYCQSPNFFFPSMQAVKFYVGFSSRLEDFEIGKFYLDFDKQWFQVEIVRPTVTLFRVDYTIVDGKIENSAYFTTLDEAKAAQTELQNYLDKWGYMAKVEEPKSETKELAEFLGQGFKAYRLPVSGNTYYSSK